MNDSTRKAANALVAVVDFFSGALAQEAQTRDSLERHVQQLADQLKNYAELEAALKRQSELAKELSRKCDLLAAENEQLRREIDGTNRG